MNSFCRSSTEAVPSVAMTYAVWPMVRPPRSPMFSPTVSWPLTCSPGRSRGSKASYCVDERLRLHLERRLVVGGPPVVEVAVAVVLRALVVEAVADLVADDRADAAVVLGRLGVGRKNGFWRMPAGKQISLVPGL